MTIHVHTAPKQPATRYLIHAVQPSMVITNRPRTPFRAFCCKRLRYAVNLDVQAYYDGSYYFCRPGKGCKR